MSPSKLPSRAQAARAGARPSRRVLRRLLRHRGAVAGALILLIVLVVSLLAPITAPNPATVDPLNRLVAPQMSHLFGTDNLGRDVFAQTIWGGRAALLISLVSTGLAVASGYVIGVIVGYFRTVDGVVMRIMDGLMSFPSIVLMICLIGVLGNGIFPLILGLTIGMVPFVARIVRGASLSAKELTMVESVRAAGARTPYILFRYIAPEAVSVVLVQATMLLASGVLAVAALSFLGIGLDPSVPSWGSALSTAQQYFVPAWWMAVFPGVAILITILGFILLGDALRDVLDPKAREE
jgi:peptide/nickel transport system permease protein